jgi:hypothetical protein
MIVNKTDSAYYTASLTSMRTISNLNVISITFSSPPHPLRAQTSMSFPRSSLPALSRRIFNRSSQSGETNFAHSYIWSQVGDANVDSRNESNARSMQWWFWAHGFLVSHGICLLSSMRAYVCVLVHP